MLDEGCLRYYNIRDTIIYLKHTVYYIVFIDLLDKHSLNRFWRHIYHAFIRICTGFYQCAVTRSSSESPCRKWGQEKVIELKSLGATVPEIVKKLSIGRSTVYKILQQAQS